MTTHDLIRESISGVGHPWRKPRYAFGIWTTCDWSDDPLVTGPSELLGDIERHWVHLPRAHHTIELCGATGFSTEEFAGAAVLSQELQRWTLLHRGRPTVAGSLTDRLLQKVVPSGTDSFKFRRKDDADAAVFGWSPDKNAEAADVRADVAWERLPRRRRRQRWAANH